MTKSEWLASDWTEQLVAELEDGIETLKDGWMNGTFTEETIEGSMQKSIQMMATAQAFLSVLESIRGGEDE